jgi:hypothetical protein
MAIQGFPADWDTLIYQATRLDDNFRRRAQETKGVAPKWKSIPEKKKQNRHPDEIDWVAGSVTKQYRKTRKAPGAFKKKIKGNCYNCDKPGHFAKDCKSRQAKAAQPGRGKAPKRQANAAEHGALS